MFLRLTTELYNAYRKKEIDRELTANERGERERERERGDYWRGSELELRRLR